MGPSTAKDRMVMMVSCVSSCRRGRDHVSATASHTARSGATRAEPKGLAELYERNAPSAVRLAYLITSDPELAQDITQEAFVRVAGRFRHLRTPDAFDAYLRRTVVNLCNSHFRHQRVVRVALEREAGLATRAVEGPDPSLRDELRAALRHLPTRQRTALVLHYYEDLSEEQLADAMHCSVSAARSLVAHGKQTLRTLIWSGER
jgi:RNA polymerase sigma-70 factor (sigma-E family)